MESKILVLNDDMDSGNSSTHTHTLLTTYKNPRLPTLSCSAIAKQTETSTRLFEVNSLAPSKYNSYFANNSVISDGKVFVATPIDPLFLVLPILASVASKLSPFDQLVSEVKEKKLLPDCGSGPGSSCLSEESLEKVCIVSDVMGDDMLLYKFDEAKCLAWLVAKYERVLALLTEREGRKVANGTDKASAFDTSFNMGNDSSSTSTSTSTSTSSPKNSPPKLQKNAITMICEYLTSEWGEKLCSALNFKDTSILTTGNGSKKRKQVWDEEDTAQKMEEYTMGRQGTTFDELNKEQIKKNEEEKKKEAQKQKLAKINTKGMKSLSSFFGAPPKTKK
ncbi:hypothetical protein ScalyP_jg11973 [Parmales sp. scaly parma]|nr:hypothetical protein ScalyP_jg11973 [Parmales sp. scaly parma]